MSDEQMNNFQKLKKLKKLYKQQGSNCMRMAHRLYDIKAVPTPSEGAVVVKEFLNLLKKNII